MLKILSKIKLNYIITKNSNNLLIAFNSSNQFNKCFSTTSYKLVNAFDSSIFDIFNGGELKTTKNINREWKKLLTKAEKCVGYPTSFLSLRYLISDEVANVAGLLRKLMKTNHPLIDTAKKLINEPDKYTQFNGLIVLLVSKAIGSPQKNTFLSTDLSDGIHKSQRRLAEICEMINMASIIHRGVINVEKLSDDERRNMDYGNKIAILCGDYLLANACTNLSKLENPQVVDLMSQVIADISQAIFIKEDNGKNINSFLKYWYEELYSSSSSLLANTCKSAMLLVKQTIEVQTNVWNFANNFDITHKIWVELNQYKNDKNILKPNTLLNAIYNDKKIVIGDEKKINVDEVVNECVCLFDRHYNESLKYLNLIRNKNSEIDAISSLESILNLMKNTIE